jgi:RNA polymerase sigma-70 factor (ECF subfamily)
VQAARPRLRVEAAEANRVTHAFFVAARDGDTATLALLLAQAVEIPSDGGGKVFAFRNVVRGVDRALRLFAGLLRQNAQSAQLLRTAEIDGLSGHISVDRGLVQTTALDIRDGKITAIYIVRNPDKLRHLTGDMIG